MNIYRRVDIFTWLLKRTLLFNFNELQLYDEKCALNAEKRQSPQVKFWKVDENGVSRSKYAWPVFGPLVLIHSFKGSYRMGNGACCIYSQFGNL